MSWTGSIARVRFFCCDFRWTGHMRRDRGNSTERGLTASVALPPGRARFVTKPAATGSGVCVNTIGMVRVACNSGPTTGPPQARMTSGASAANSAAYFRMLAESPAVQRMSMRRLRPISRDARLLTQFAVFHVLARGAALLDGCPPPSTHLVCEDAATTLKFVSMATIVTAFSSRSLSSARRRSIDVSATRSILVSLAAR